MTYDEFVKLALELPDTNEVGGKSGLGVNRGDHGMFWLKKGKLLCIHTDWDNHDRLLNAHPNVIYKTPHFEGYPAVHAHLEMLSDDLAKELIQIACEFAPNKVRMKRKPKS